MKRLFILALNLIFAITGCSSIQSDITDEKSKVYLAASTEQTTETKAPYLATDPKDAPLTVLILASTTENSFPNTGKDGTDSHNGVINKHIEANFQNSQQQLINGIYYNRNHSSDIANFVGLYPSTGWTGKDTYTIVTREFDGKTDLMYAPATKGQYGNQLKPKLIFKHLLTYLKIELSAENEGAISAWGAIESMTINCRNTLNLDITTGQVSYPGTPSECEFYNKFDDSPFVSSNKPYTLTVEAKEAAYILCAPVDAIVKEQYEPFNRIPEYTITLSTTYRKNIVLDIDLKTAEGELDAAYFNKNTAGYMFTIGLKFKMGNNIAISTSITDWTTGGIGTGEVEL
jgi:hypothetical protein